MSGRIKEIIAGVFGNPLQREDPDPNRTAANREAHRLLSSMPIDPTTGTSEQVESQDGGQFNSDASLFYMLVPGEEPDAHYWEILRAHVETMSDREIEEMQRLGGIMIHLLQVTNAMGYAALQERTANAPTTEN